MLIAATLGQEYYLYSSYFARVFDLISILDYFMKKLVLLIIGIIFGGTLLAQPPQFSGRGGGSSINGKIAGTVLDTVTGNPIEFATVVLLKDGKQINGIVTEGDGAFKLLNVPTGKYDVQISFLGYESKTITGVETTPKSPDADLGTILLVSQSIDLGEVEVTGERAAFEAKIDKIVYNAEKDVSTAGGDAADVLARVPLLAIDGEGNVSLRGSSNLQILINGRPSIIFQGGNVGDALRTLNADQIKSVEVITVPTARYDGEGSGGIINIITKKKSVKGFTGTLSGALGNISNRGSVNLNYARNRFGLNFNGSGWMSWPRESFGEFFRTDQVGDQQRVLEQDSEGESVFYGPRFSLGATYDFNAYNALTSSMTYRGFGRNNDNRTDAVFRDPVNNIFQEYERISESNSLRGGFDWTTDYRRTFKKKGQEFAFAFQISGDNSNSDNTILQQSIIDEDPTIYQNQRNENDGLNLETTFQLDYIHPFSEAIKMETGAKAILRTITSDFRFRIFDPDQDEYVTDPLLSDEFTYEQDVYAGYLSFNVKLSDKYSMIIGSRYEQTEIAGRFQFQDSSNFANDYGNFLPSFIISRKFGQFTSLRASYTKRIQRPGLRFVNPYIELEDPRDIEQGNPFLDPENSDQYELNLNTYLSGVVLNASVFYRQTNDVIERFLTVIDDGVSYTTYRNVGTAKAYGFNLFSSGTIAKKLKVRGGVNIENYQSEGIIGGERLTNNVWVWGGNLNFSYQLPKDLVFEINGFYRSPRASLQGTRASYRRISFGARKEFMDKRASLGLVISQPFAEFLEFENELEGPTFYQRSLNAFQSRNIALSFSYRFGKLDFNNRNRPGRSRIKNDDQKGGGGGQEYN